MGDAEKKEDVECNRQQLIKDKASRLHHYAWQCRSFGCG